MIENILIGILLLTLLLVVVLLISSKGDTTILYPLGVPMGIFLTPVIIVLLSIWTGRLFETYMPPEIKSFLALYWLPIFILLGIIMLLNDYRNKIKLKKLIKDYNKAASPIVKAYNHLLENKQDYEQKDIEKIESIEKWIGTFKYGNLDFKDKNTLSFKGDISRYKREGELGFHLNMVKNLLEELQIRYSTYL